MANTVEAHRHGCRQANSVIAPKVRRKLNWIFMPASLATAQRKCPSTVLVLRERRRALPAENYQSRAGNDIVMRQK